MSGIQMALLGASISGLDIQTITTGAIGAAIDQDRERGYDAPPAGFGSIVDGTSNIYGGATIGYFKWVENGGLPYYALYIGGATNSGWTQVDIGGVKTLTRASAIFNVAGIWAWNTSDTAAGQAFGAAGTVRVCVFT